MVVMCIFVVGMGDVEREVTGGRFISESHVWCAPLPSHSYLCVRA
jgi:hypothetical protein